MPCFGTLKDVRIQVSVIENNVLQHSSPANVSISLVGNRKPYRLALSLIAFVIFLCAFGYYCYEGKVLQNLIP